MAVTYASFAAHGVMAATVFVTDAATYPQSVVEQVITEVNCITGAGYWHSSCTDCDRRDTAMIYLVAHRLAKMTQLGILGGTATAGTAPGINPGNIASLSSSQGSQSVSFSSGSSSSQESELWKAEGNPSTHWWEQYLVLQGSREPYVGTVA